MRAATIAGSALKTTPTSRNSSPRSAAPTTSAVATASGTPAPARRPSSTPSLSGASRSPLLDQVGAPALEAALTEALARGAISAASVAHVLDQRRRARHQPPLLDLVLPADPRVRDLRVTPHALSAYDTLLTRPPATPEETPDGSAR
jgi:hypothetical protein